MATFACVIPFMSDKDLNAIDKYLDKTSNNKGKK